MPAMQNITSVLDRLQDRSFETIKSWTSMANLRTLRFDLVLMEKDIEQLKNLIAEEEKRPK